MVKAFRFKTTDNVFSAWQFIGNITAEMATAALRNATLNIKDTEGIMIHSFSRKANPYDNACIESFHAALKKEEVYTKIDYDFEDAKRAIFEYIECWYNRKRIHGSLNYMTPQEKEDKFTGA